MDRVLIIDDHVELCKLLEERLGGEGIAMEFVHDGLRGLERGLSAELALIILDLMLPGLNGLSILRRQRAQSSVPVLILSARGEDVDRILGLEIGADDYLAKPFNSRELIARIRAILRRTNRMNAVAAPLTVGDIYLDPASREVMVHGVPIGLTNAEFTLLEVLLQDAGHILSREHLTETVLGRKPGPFDRVIDVHISNFRKKLGSLQGSERIKAVRAAATCLWRDRRSNQTTGAASIPQDIPLVLGNFYLYRHSSCADVRLGTAECAFPMACNFGRYGTLLRDRYSEGV
jgi:DNA-binding response OmpR family regulator